MRSPLVIVLFCAFPVLVSPENFHFSSQNRSNVTVTSSPLRNQSLQATSCRAANAQIDLIKLWKNFPITFTSDVDVNPECKEATKRFIKGIQGRKLWALKMLDASAKLPAGILSGNVNQFGNYDECLSVPQAQYCLAEIDPARAWERTKLPFKELVHSFFAFRGSFDDPQHRVPDFASIKWGVCVPKECTPEDLQQSLEQTFGVGARVQPSLCKRSQTTYQLTFGDYFARFFFAALFLAVTTASAAAHYKASVLTSENKLMRILLAFSLQNNLKELLNIDERDCNSSKDKVCDEASSIDQNRHGEIRSVHGIRALSALALLMCHKSVALMYNPYTNRTEMAEDFGKEWSVMGRTAIVYTDSFMLLSGLLSANALLKDLELHKSFRFKDKVVTRIFRITPSILALILFCTYILPSINSGPLWPMVVEHHADLCKQYMWRNLLYIHNYFGFENMCLTHTHQIGIDMQLFLLTPLIVGLWWTNKKWGIYTTAVIALLSTILRYWATVQYNLSHMIYFGIPVKQMFDTANFSYILPTHRATIYLFGVTLAYILRHSYFNISKLYASLCWVVSLSLGVYAVLGPFHMAKMGYVYNKTDAAIFGSLSPVWWGICLSWVIYASNRGFAGWFGDLLSWGGFKLFTKIAYAFYLVQFPVIFYFIGSQRNAERFGHSVILHYGETFIVVLLSVALTVCVEMPFQKINKVLFSNLSSRSKAIIREKSKNGSICRSG